MAVVGVLAVALATIFILGEPQPQLQEGKVSVVATFYPLAYMVQEIGGDHVSVRVLIPYNTEVHSWQPSVSDMIALANADLIVLNGAGLEPWFKEKVLPSLNLTRTVVLDTTEGLELLALGEDEHEADEHGHGGEYDPHTWISPYMAERQAERIYSALVEVDPKNSDYYSVRWESLKARLNSLDAQYQQGLANRSRNEIITSHGAYGYLCSRYGFEQHSVIGLTADKQPSVQELRALVDLMVGHNISVLYVDPAYSTSYMDTLKSELEGQTGMEVKILKLYLGLGPIDGKDYLDQLASNLESLKSGLVTG
ncbi:MAG: metal ABC transporter substrate-binding protein [Candidatus Methanosuratincola sp.]|nr:zinc ABC transporter substrate-binding protein [Candidatus Methanosuratincola sp.]